MVISSLYLCINSSVFTRIRTQLLLLMSVFHSVVFLILYLTIFHCSICLVFYFWDIYSRSLLFHTYIIYVCFFLSFSSVLTSVRTSCFSSVSLIFKLAISGLFFDLLNISVNFLKLLGFFVCLFFLFFLKKIIYF